MSDFKSGLVSIIGRPNVGKSTLLNSMVEQKLSIISRKPQTTRWNLQAIKTLPKGQIVFIDTPGLQKKPSIALNRHMNREVFSVLEFVDIVLFVVEACKWHELDENVLSALKKTNGKKLFLVVNKMDKVKHKPELLPYINEIASRIHLDEIIPVSARKSQDLNKLTDLIIENLPVGPAMYPEDQVTDRNERFFAAEFIREKLINRVSDELPYRTSITIDEFRDMEKVIHIQATIWVEKSGQKSIVIGAGGEVLKSIGQAARKEMEILFDKKVNLKTWVKVKKKWPESDEALRQLGYHD